jgi:hypothetical protein
VTHELAWQIFYSIEGQAVNGKPIDGPGELRMMQVKMPCNLPSCCNISSALSLPTCEASEENLRLTSRPKCKLGS